MHDNWGLFSVVLSKITMQVRMGMYMAICANHPIQIP